ncbi:MULTISPECIES: hypothetical protein [Vibrio]|uniref:hypothetical protein n=1 Tax=Vibrio TaxID=662 RepID=UPI00111AAE1F|nr:MULTISPECIES: hypothetical protein [Vibrio]UQV24856.1 hypothetical protein M4S28_26350 [Vibrio sp. J383]
MSENILETSEMLKDKVKKLGKFEKGKMFEFFQTFEQGGFTAIDNYFVQGHKVRNKASDDVDTNDPDFIAKVKFAQQHSLWHFHVGFYDFGYDLKGYEVSKNGELTSQWVIHYQKFADNHINVADLTPHPPFELPPKEALK